MYIILSFVFFFDRRLMKFRGEDNRFRVNVEDF